MERQRVVAKREGHACLQPDFPSFSPLKAPAGEAVLKR